MFPMIQFSHFPRCCRSCVTAPPAWQRADLIAWHDDYTVFFKGQKAELILKYETKTRLSAPKSLCAFKFMRI